MEGLETTPIYQFKGVRDIADHVSRHVAELARGDSTQQFIAFRGVETKDLVKIDKARSTINKDTRLTYQFGNLLIIKLMPYPAHESAHLPFADVIRTALFGMGLPLSSLYPVGTGRFFSLDTSKESDSGCKPANNTRPHEFDWPSLVFETGLSESLVRLRQNAKW
jgi:hypothetical protein